jgi:uncharacterized RDD family membrane protein YckC
MGAIIPAMREAPAAGFWIRAVAFVVDVIVLAIVQASLDVAASIVFGVDPEQALAISSTVSFFTMVFAALYTTVLHASGGQTIGKRLAGVRVVALDGEPPLGGTAFLRWLAYFASFVTFGLGFLMAGLRADKRALHDLIAGTRVERVTRERRDDEVREQTPLRRDEDGALQPVVADEPSAAPGTREPPPPPP